MNSYKQDIHTSTAHKWNGIDETENNNYNRLGFLKIDWVDKPHLPGRFNDFMNLMQSSL